jgi:hypothetical protein
VAAESTSEPKVALRQISLARDAPTNRWNIRWQVDNLGTDALKIVSLRLPHGQFKSDEQHFTPALELAKGASEQFQCLVQCEEPAGLVTENAFVIFHCQWRGEAWRIFIRMRVTVTANGAPETATELITTQKVGFSGIVS